MNSMTVVTEDPPAGETVRREIWYRLKDGQWHVKPPGNTEYEPFADGSAHEEDVRQLIRKEHSARY